MDNNALLQLADSLNNIADSQNNIADAVKRLTSSLAVSEVEPTFAEKVRLIVAKLGPRKTARRIDVDNSALIRWRNGGASLKKNRLKIEALYRELCS